MTDTTLSNLLALCGAAWYAGLFAIWLYLVQETRRKARVQRIIRRLQ